MADRKGLKVTSFVGAVAIAIVLIVATTAERDVVDAGSSAHTNDRTVPGSDQTIEETSPGAAEGVSTGDIDLEDGLIRPGAGSEFEIAAGFVGAKSAVEASEFSTLARENGYEALSVFLDDQLAGSCLGMDSAQPGSEGAGWAFDQIQDYCDSYLPSMVQSAEAHYQDGGTSPVLDTAARLTKRFDALNKEERTKEAAYFAANAQSPMDVHAANLALANLASNDPGFLPFLGQSRQMTEDEFLNALDYAMLRVQCRLFGGCGPTGMTLLTRCALTGVCQRGWDMEILLFETLSPMEHEQVSEMTMYLLSLRDKG